MESNNQNEVSYDAASLPLVWECTHHLVNGIGRFWVSPCLKVNDQLVPLDSLALLGKGDMPSLLLHGVRIIGTATFRQRYADWQTNSIKPFILFPQEILGTHRNRLSQILVEPPEISVPSTANESEQAIQLLTTMREYGLPAGFSGLQNEVGDIFAHVCSDLLRDAPNAKILWIMPRRRREAMTEALHKAEIPTTETPENLDGRVMLYSPDTKLPANIDWTLIIFTDLDVIATGEVQYANLSRLWSLCTFARPDWTEYSIHANRQLHALGLSPDDSIAFQQICTRTFPEQTDNLIKRLVSPFKTITFGEEEPSGAVAIPKPSSVPLPKPAPSSTSTRQPSVPLKTPDIDSVFRPTFAPSSSEARVEGTFLEQARHYASMVEDAAEFVPFAQYFPTYDALTSAQRNWYFYWRGQARKKNFLPTDLSYLFLHIYEGLHLIGFENAPTAFNYLSGLWQHYRTAHPNLDGYLVDWLADFLVVYKLPRSPIEWYSRAYTKYDVDIDANIALEAWLQSNSGDITRLPDTVLEWLCVYDRRKSKFYQKHNADDVIEAAYRESLQQIDAHLRARSGRSLFEYFRPAEIAPLKRQPFAGAIYEGEREEITLGEVSDWASSDELHTAITNIIKYTENRLRRQRSFHGTLQGVTLPRDWIAVLDAAFPTADDMPKPAAKSPDRKPKTSLTIQEAIVAPTTIDPDEPSNWHIDFGAMKALLVEAQTTQETLTLDDEVDEMLVLDESERDVETLIEFDTERPTDTPDHLLTDLTQIAEIIGQDRPALALLLFLREQDWEADEADAQHAVENEFLSVVVDRLNTRALDRLPDKLIYIDDERLIVAEDYRDELDHLLTHQFEPVLAGGRSNTTEADRLQTLTPYYDELKPEWVEFVQRMRAYHWEALNVLLIGDDVALRLEGVARAAHTMVSLMINEINEFALGSIGDIIIDSTVEPPFIEEEDQDELRALNTWTLQHLIQEF